MPRINRTTVLRTVPFALVTAVLRFQARPLQRVALLPTTLSKQDPSWRLVDLATPPHRLVLQHMDASPIRIQTTSCLEINNYEMRHTLATCFNTTVPIFENSQNTPDLVLRCGVTFPDYVEQKYIQTEQCDFKNTTKTWVAHASAHATRPGQRILGSFSGLWGPTHAIGSKQALCQLSNRLRQTFPHVRIAPPCLVIPLLTKSSDTALTANHPYWIFKPTFTKQGHVATTGKGIRFVQAAEIALLTEQGSVQAYIHNPLVLQRQLLPNTKKIPIKVDLRIFGVQTSVQPMRLFLSDYGFYRTGHPTQAFNMSVGFDENEFLHATNSDKIRAGIFENSRYNFPKQRRVPYAASMEEEFSSAGTMQQFWKIIKDQGLSKELVWGNLVTLFAHLHAGSQEWMLQSCPSASVGAEHVCHQEFVPFFADVGVDEHGNVTLYETHPSCNFKPCHSVLQEMSGCFHSIVTEYATRPASWGTTAMGFARFFEPDFRKLAHNWVDNKLPRTQLHRCTDSDQTLARDGCLSVQAEDILVEMAQEEFLACQMGVQDAFFVLRQDTDKSGVDLDADQLRDTLHALLDDTTIRYYSIYKQLQLGDLATRMSNRHCRPGVRGDTAWFGHGEDNGCSSGRRP